MDQHSGVWNSAVSAVVWKLPQLYLESGVLHSGSFDKCLGTPDATWGIYPGTYGWYMAVLLGTPKGKWEFPQEPIYGWLHSANMAILITCADILSVSPYQMCLCDLGSFPLDPKCHGWLTAILVEVSDSTLFIYFMVS